MKRRTREKLLEFVNVVGTGVIFVLFMNGLFLYWAGWVHIKGYAIFCAILSTLLFVASEKLDDSRDEIGFDDLEDETFSMRGRR